MLKKIRHIGIHDNITLSELKRVQLLNTIFSTTIILYIVISFFAIFTTKLPILYIFGSLFFAELFNIYLLQKRYYKTAYYFFIITHTLFFGAFKLFLGSDIGVQFIFLFIIYLTYLLFDKWWIRIPLVVMIMVVYLGAFYLNMFLPTEYLMIFPNHLYFKSGLFLGYVWLISYLINHYHKEVVMEGIKQENLIQRLKIQNEKLQNATNEMGRFNYIASHDLKSPLRSIISFFGLMKRKLKQEKYEDLPKKLSYLKESSEQMNTLLTDIEIFSKINQIADNQTTIELMDVIQNVLIDLNSKLETKKVQVLVQDDLPTLHANYEEIKFVFLNLIENGFQYNTSDNPTIFIKKIENKTDIIIEVKDNGIGINEEYQTIVFEYFKRLHNYKTYSGSGLGLGICKKIIQRMNGKITLQSIPNQGSTFIIQLPKT